MLGRCLRPTPKASPLASTSQLTIEQSLLRCGPARKSATLALPLRASEVDETTREDESAGDRKPARRIWDWRSGYRWAPSTDRVQPRRWAKRAWEGPRVPASKMREGFRDLSLQEAELLKDVYERHDYVAQLRLTDEILARLAPGEGVSRRFLHVRLSAILANEAYDRLVGIEELIERCQPKPDSHHYDLAMQAFLAASNVDAAKRMYSASVGLKKRLSLERQRNLHLGYRAAASGMVHIRRMMRHAIAQGKGLRNAERLVSLWIDMHIEQGFYRFSELLVRRFDWRGTVKLPALQTSRSTHIVDWDEAAEEFDSYRAHAVMDTLRPTADVCLVAMKLYNTLERPDVVQSIWRALSKLDIKPVAGCVQELLRSLPLRKALATLEGLDKRLLKADVVGALLPVVCERYGVSGLRDVFGWMSRNALRPTPVMLKEYLVILSKEESMTPARLASLCSIAVDASDGVLALSDSHAVVLLEHAAGWAEAKMNPPLDRRIPRRTIAKPGIPIHSLPAPPSAPALHQRTTTGRQTAFLEGLRAAMSQVAFLPTSRKGALRTVDLDDPNLGLGRILVILSRIYQGPVKPSQQTVAAMMRLAALGGMPSEDLVAVFRDQVGSRGLTRTPAHLKPLVLSTFLRNNDNPQYRIDFDHAFRASGLFANRLHILWAGAILSLFITALVAAGQPLHALAVFRQAERSDDLSRMTPEVYAAAASAAAAAGDVDLLRSIHTEMHRRFGPQPPKTESVYLVTLFETLIRLQEPDTAQREALQALTCGMMPDEVVLKAIVDSGKKMRRTLRRLQALQANLVAASGQSKDAPEPDGTANYDHARFSWQLRHVAERTAALQRALDLQVRVESLAHEQVARVDRPPPMEGDEPEALAKRMGELARVPAWIKWAQEQQRIDQEGGLRKGLYAALEEGLRRRKEANMKNP